MNDLVCHWHDTGDWMTLETEIDDDVDDLHAMNYDDNDALMSLNDQDYCNHDNDVDVDQVNVIEIVNENGHVHHATS